MENSGYTVQKRGETVVFNPKEHRHTIVFLHGLDQKNQSFVEDMKYVLGTNLKFVKVVMPQAPRRYVTAMKGETTSWFDIKFRNEKSFIVPFDEAFSSKQVIDSFEMVLKPIIQEERSILGTKGKLIVSGFSQGCGMSMHCLFSLPNLVDSAVGIAGYLFPFTPFKAQLQARAFVINGLADKLRPWEYVKVTYEGKLNKTITLIEGMGHEINKNTRKEMVKIYCMLLDLNVPKL